MSLADTEKGDDSGGISLAEKMLSNKKEDSLEDDDEPKDEDKSKIDYWASQDVDGSKKKAAEAVKAAAIEKKKKEEEEKQLQSKLESMSDEEKRKLQHDALQSASFELKKKKSDEDPEVDELQGDWEQADEYAQYMSKAQKKADEHHKLVKKSGGQMPTEEELKK